MLAEHAKRTPYKQNTRLMDEFHDKFLRVLDDNVHLFFGPCCPNGPECEKCYPMGEFCNKLMKADGMFDSLVIQLHQHGVGGFAQDLIKDYRRCLISTYLRLSGPLTRYHVQNGYYRDMYKYVDGKIEELRQHPTYISLIEKFNM